MIVYILVRRLKQNIFLEADEGDSVYELKLMLEGILKAKPSDQRLYHLASEDRMGDDGTVLMSDEQKLNDYGINSTHAKAQSPAKIGLALRSEQGASGFEQLEITSYSNPPPLPDIMKSTPAAGDETNKA